jgi:hypothetical protein
VVPASSSSALDDAEDLHVLGYLVDPHPALLEALAESCRSVARAAAAAEALRACGLSTSPSALRSVVPISRRLPSIIPSTGCASSARRS